MTQNRTSVTKPVFQGSPKQQGGGHPDLWGGESHSRGQVIQQRRCISRVPINGIVYSKELCHPNPVGSYLMWFPSSLPCYIACNCWNLAQRSSSPRPFLINGDPATVYRFEAKVNPPLYASANSTI